MPAEQLRESVKRLIKDVEASDPRELARELFREDGELSEALIRAYPRLVSAALQAMKSFMESVESMPAEKSVGLVAHSYAQVDGGEIGATINALSRLIIRLHEQNPELFAANKTGVVSDAMKTLDFGKLRKAITYRVEEKLEFLRGDVELLGDNPVALVNLFSVVAPIVNNALGLSKTLFGILALPGEAMAYALFKIMEDIDWREFATVVNGAAGIIVTLHRGNFILGDGSLHSRGPVSRISSDFVGELDGQVIAEAIAAIGKEGEVFITSFANQALNNESLVLPLAESVISLANSIFRTTASILEKANTLPPETVGKIALAMAGDLETGKLGRALSSLASLSRKLSDENPELYGKLLRETVSAFDLNLKDILGPEALGAGANQAISSYNRWAGANPGLVAEGLDGFLGAIDARELDQAARATSAQVVKAVTRHPEVVKTVAKTVLSILYQGAKGYVMGLRVRRRAREV